MREEGRGGGEVGGRWETEEEGEKGEGGGGRVRWVKKMEVKEKDGGGKEMKKEERNKCY